MIRISLLFSHCWVSDCQWEARILMLLRQQVRAVLCICELTVKLSMSLFNFTAKVPVSLTSRDSLGPLSPHGHHWSLATQCVLSLPVSLWLPVHSLCTGPGWAHCGTARTRDGTQDSDSAFRKYCIPRYLRETVCYDVMLIAIHCYPWYPWQIKNLWDPSIIL